LLRELLWIHGIELRPTSASGGQPTAPATITGTDAPDLLATYRWPSSCGGPAISTESTTPTQLRRRPAPKPKNQLLPRRAIMTAPTIAGANQTSAVTKVQM